MSYQNLKSKQKQSKYQDFSIKTRPKQKIYRSKNMMPTFKYSKHIYIFGAILLAITFFALIKSPTQNTTANTSKKPVIKTTKVVQTSQPKTDLDFPQCDFVKPRFLGVIALTCKSASATIHYEKFDSIQNVNKTIDDYALGADSKDPARYIRIGKSGSYMRALTLDTQSLTLMNIESKSTQEQLEQYLDSNQSKVDAFSTGFESSSNSSP